MGNIRVTKVRFSSVKRLNGIQATEEKAHELLQVVERLVEFYNASGMVIEA